ncbi:MAG: Hsp20/alpha crystallin family protein [Planctomycetaceae bacterium]
MTNPEMPEDPTPPKAESPQAGEADSALARRPIELPAPQDEPVRWLRTPPIDIFETDAGLMLRADLPGVTGETLELQVQDNKLTLFGRVEPPREAAGGLAHQEYHVGDFLRSFILSDDIDHDRIEAKLTDGVLQVLLPRSAGGRDAEDSSEDGLSDWPGDDALDPSPSPFTKSSCSWCGALTKGSVETGASQWSSVARRAGRASTDSKPIAVQTRTDLA